MWVNIVRFVHNYQLKWLAADITFVSDILANGVWGSKYYEIFGVFGIQPSTVNAGISALELIRVGILLYQRAIERQAQSPETSALDHKQDGTENK